MKRLPHTPDPDDRLAGAIDRLWSRQHPLGDPARVAGLTDERMAGPERRAAFLAFVAVLNTTAAMRRLRAGHRLRPIFGSANPADAVGR